MIGIPVPPIPPGSPADGTPFGVVLALIAIVVVAAVMLVAIVRGPSTKRIVETEAKPDLSLPRAA